MQVFLSLTRRELAAYFLSLVGYVLIAVAVLQMGLGFFVLLTKLQADSTPVPLNELFFDTPFFWMILLISTPVITMRLFALEKSSGTFETLMTAPVSDLQVVLAKFFAAVFFYIVMWLPLLLCFLILRHYSSDPSALDLHVLGTTFAGITLIGLLFLSAGTLASAITSSQIIAAILALGLGLALFMVSFLGDHVPLQQQWVGDVLSYINMREHMIDFARGVVDTRHVAFYLSSTVFFLIATYRAVESRRWK